MAEVLCALNPEDIKMFMPMQEMLKSQHQEIYKAVGEQLLLYVKFTGEMPLKGDFLVCLDDGRAVAFSFGVNSEESEYSSWHS